MTPRVAIALACALTGVVGWGCGAARPPADPRRDLVLVLVDTLRADFVGVSGRAPYPATPEIDRLARRGRWFSDAWSCAPWTPPSVMSLMTSLEPPVHGLDLEGQRLAEVVPGLPLRASSLAEVLRAAGYRTLAVTAGGGVGSALGFDRGFERFFEPDRRPASDVESGVDRAIEWLAEPDPRPTFLFFHTYEVHLPNTHPPIAEVADAADGASRAQAAYAGDLAVADRHLGRLFAALELDGGLERSLVVVTSDHGENLHDRMLGERPVEHGHHLHVELLRVPLIMVAPGLIPAAGEIGGPVTLLDVVPTVCALLGIGLDDVPHQGRDLGSVLLGRQGIDGPSTLYGWAPLQGPTWGAIRTAEWTYLSSPRIETDQWWGTVELAPETLFHRPTDAGETADLAADRPEIVGLLAARLAERARVGRDLRRSLGVTRELDEGVAESLRELGYLDREPASTD